MGIKRLYSYLRYAFVEEDLSKLSGKKVGIDAMGWLYQAYFCQCDLEAEIKLGIVRNMERKISLLEKNLIEFIFVIDGLNLPCKNSTLQKRKNKRQKFYQKSIKMEKEKYDIGESAVYRKYSETISKEIVHFFIDFLKHRGNEFIVAPYEADSQLNYMYQKKKIDYIMSEDSDIAGYGCEHIVKGVRKNGKCSLINKEIIEKFGHSLKQKRKERDPNYTKMHKAYEFFCLTKEEKILLSIYSGCDYLENIKGIGFGTLISYFPDSINGLKLKIKNLIKKSIGSGNLPDDIENAQHYFERVELVQKSFNHQLVYDKKLRKFVRLSKLKKPFEHVVYDYVGNVDDFDEVNQEDFSNGDLDLEDLDEREIEDYDFKKDIKFIKKKPSMGLLNNLCTQTYGYANFQDFEDNEKSYESESEAEFGKKKKPKDISNRCNKKIKNNTTG